MLVKIYTDGAARGNPDGPGGYGTVLEYVDTKGGGGGKQCLMERCDAPLLCSDRKHQKQRAHQINCRETCNNDLKRRKTVLPVTRILNHKSSFTYPCA